MLDEALTPKPIKSVNFALSSCPGKKVRLDSGPVNGKAMISRDLAIDLDRIVSFGIKTIICCLGDKELKHLGAPWEDYHRECVKRDVSILRLPMVDGFAPESIEEVETIFNQLDEKGHILCHCRGGIGRAGLVACCYLIRKGICKNAKEAIKHVRKYRSSKAIETRIQENFIQRYYEWYTK